MREIFSTIVVVASVSYIAYCVGVFFNQVSGTVSVPLFALSVLLIVIMGTIYQKK